MKTDYGRSFIDMNLTHIGSTFFISEHILDTDTSRKMENQNLKNNRHPQK